MAVLDKRISHAMQNEGGTGHIRDSIKVPESLGNDILGD